MDLSVLLVDDSVTMRKLIRKIILMSGVPVRAFHEAGSAPEGLALVEKHRPDLAMVDINLPQMSGMDMIRKLRADPATRDLPIIVISTDSSQARVRQLHGQQVHFISKPFKREQIQEVLQAYEKFSVPKITEPLLDQVAEVIFKRLAFLTLNPADPNDPVPSGPRTRANMKFAGPFRGTLVLDASDSLLPVLLNNMLGVDQDAPNTEKDRLDAFGEMANVLCGNLLELLAGPRMVFDLATPSFETEPEVGVSNGDRAFVRRWASDKGWIELSFFRDYPKGTGQEVQP